MNNFDYKELTLQKIRCPVCLSEEFELLSSSDRYKMGIQTQGCKNCSLIFTNPRPSLSDIDLFYKSYYRMYYQSVDKPSIDYIKKYKKDRRASYHVDFISKSISLESDSSILDFGCSEGSLLKEFGRINRECHLFGVELGDTYREFASTYSGAHVKRSLDEFNDEKFDLVTLIHVFEHIANPIDFLESLSCKLKEGGYIYVDVPSVNHYRTISDVHFAHLVHYSETTLENCFRVLGMEVLFIEVHQPPGHPKSIRCLAKNNSKRVKLDIVTDTDSFLIVKALTKRHFLNLIINSPIYGIMKAVTPNFIKNFLKG